jgi:RNA polymerase sigma-70 factor (ECF subfamily)
MIQSGNCETGNEFDENLAIAPQQRSLYASEKQERGRSAGLFSFDREYVRRLSQGDPETERHFVGYFEPLLLIKIRCRLRSGQDISDLSQEVFLRVIRSIRGGNGVNDPACLGAFVNAVCNNVLLEYFRQHGKLTQIDKDTPEPLDAGAGGEQELLTDEIRRNVRSLLNELPPKDRKILQAVLIEERDKDHICRDCGVNRDYLRVLLHRARNRFRQLLADAGYRVEKQASTSATYSQ